MPRRSLTAKQREEPFGVDAILRYDLGPTALFKVETVYPGYGGSIARYYGTHCLGGSQGAYHEQCQLANDADLLMWSERESYRQSR